MEHEPSGDVTQKLHDTIVRTLAKFKITNSTNRTHLLQSFERLVHSSNTILNNNFAPWPPSVQSI